MCVRRSNRRLISWRQAPEKCYIADLLQQRARKTFFLLSLLSRTRPAMSCVCYFWSGSVDLATSTYVNYDETRVFFEKSLGGFPLHTSCNTASQKHNLSHFSRLLKSTSWIALAEYGECVSGVIHHLEPAVRRDYVQPKQTQLEIIEPENQINSIVHFSTSSALLSRHSHVLGCCIQKIEIDHPPFKPSAVRIHKHCLCWSHKSSNFTLDRAWLSSSKFQF